MKRRELLGESALLATAVAVGGSAAAGTDEPRGAKCVSTPWRIYNTPRKQEYLTRAKRVPKLPDRNTLSDDELEDFDFLVARMKAFGTGWETIDGEGYAVPKWRALAVTPVIGGELARWGRSVPDTEGKSGSYSAYDHQIIDLVLALDSGYYYLLAGHAPQAVGDGWRIEALEALRDHRDDLLTKDELQLIQFVRAVRDGAMTDQIWEGMKKRLGTERGVLDYMHLVLLLDVHHRFCWAIGGPEHKREAFDKMLAELRSGVRKVSPTPPEIRRQVDPEFRK
jgi:hypothetical protein